MINTHTDDSVKEQRVNAYFPRCVQEDIAEITDRSWDHHESHLPAIEFKGRAVTNEQEARTEFDGQRSPDARDAWIVGVAADPVVVVAPHFTSSMFSAHLGQFTPGQTGPIMAGTVLSIGGELVYCS